MVKPRSHRRLPSLTVSAPHHEVTAPRPVVPVLPWFAAAVLGSAAAVVLGWLVVAVAVSAAWLTTSKVPLAALLDVASQGWLASLGARVHLGAVESSIPPLGLTALSGAAVAAAAHWAGLQWGLEKPRWRDAALLAGVSAGAFALGVLVLASLVGAPTQATAAFGGALLLGGIGAAIGALAALAPALPDWAGWVPDALRAARLGLLAMAGGSALALLVGLLQRWDRAQALHEAVSPDAVGTVIMVLLYLAYLPTMLAWAGSYVLGAGISVGTDTLVIPGSSTLGLLPAFPPFAALPPGGTVFDWGWLIIGIAAGAATGVWFGRARTLRGEAPDWRSWSWQGALAGLAVAVVWILVSWVSRGDLGTDRLVGMGPVFPALALVAVVPLALGSAAASTVIAVLLARRAAASGLDESPVPDEVPATAGALSAAEDPR